MVSTVPSPQSMTHPVMVSSPGSDALRFSVYTVPLRTLADPVVERVGGVLVMVSCAVSVSVSPFPSSTSSPMVKGPPSSSRPRPASVAQGIEGPAVVASS